MGTPGLAASRRRGMMSTASSGSAVDDVVDLVPLSPTGGGVGDSRYVDGGSRHILGYLHSMGGEFEMLWMRPRPGVCYRYATFDDAVHAIRLRVRHLE